MLPAQMQIRPGMPRLRMQLRLNACYLSIQELIGEYGPVSRAKDTRYYCESTSYKGTASVLKGIRMMEVETRSGTTRSRLTYYLLMRALILRLLAWLLLCVPL